MEESAEELISAARDADVDFVTFDIAAQLAENVASFQSPSVAGQIELIDSERAIQSTRLDFARPYFTVEYADPCVHGDLRDSPSIVTSAGHLKRFTMPHGSGKESQRQDGEGEEEECGLSQPLPTSKAEIMASIPEIVREVVAISDATVMICLSNY